jgi:ANTAR domain
MTDSGNSIQPSPKDLIEQARGIIMKRFDLDPAQALKLLRRMSQATRTQMCVVAEQVIIYNDPVKALRRLEADALGSPG